MDKYLKRRNSESPEVVKDAMMERVYSFKEFMDHRKLMTTCGCCGRMEIEESPLHDYFQFRDREKPSLFHDNNNG
jgi:hypothetical protein